MTADTNLSARPVMLIPNRQPIGVSVSLEYAKAMVEAEREACAKIVMSGQSPFIQDIAAAIRARGVTE